MSETLWLPATALKPRRLSDIPKGSLVLRQPHGRPKPPTFVLRFDDGDRRLAYQLTGGDSRDFGRAIHVTDLEETAFHIDAPFVIEGDLRDPISQWGSTDPLPGQLVMGASGAALVARIGPAAGWMQTAPVSLSSWEVITENDLKAVLGAWRIRIALSANQSVWLTPGTAAPGT